ncbi:MAG: TonB-dependent receptor [Gammaproteobacteria bacterium]|nr:TonB-dependent receptor [Gammaproteobacteria bacterium]
MTHSKETGLALIVFGLLAFTGVQAQSPDEADPSEAGLLQGSVTAEGTGAPVAGVLVTVSGGEEERFARTDAQGEFEVELDAGDYRILLSHPQYGERDAGDISIAGGVSQRAEFEISAEPQQAADDRPIEEVLVTGTYVEGGADRERYSASVLDVISQEDFKVTGDSSAIDALRRVTGLTIVNDQFVYVRGLGERYSNTTLNGATLPSPDPTRRVVPLDLFPTGVLESVDIQKTYSPELPGDFSGGLVQLQTREIANQPSFTFSASVEGNTQSTGEDALVFQPGERDWSGFDSGVRNLPGTLDALSQGGTVPLSSLTPEQREQAGESLVRVYDSEIVENPANFSLDLNWSDRIDAGAGGVGFLIGARYENDWAFREEVRRTSGLDGQGGLNVLDDGVQRRNVNTVNLASLVGLDWEMSDSHTLRNTTFLTRSTDNTTLRTFALLNENDIDVADTTFEWVERELFTQQFSGDHYFAGAGELELDWNLTYARADREEPDTRFYRYEQRDDGLYVFSDTGQSNERSFEDLSDKALSGGVDASLPLELSPAVTMTLKSGLYYADKTRDSSFRRFRFLSDFSQNDLRDVLGGTPDMIFADENIAPGLWELRETTQPTDNYEAEEQIGAVYATADTELGKSFRVAAGARYEDSEQVVRTFSLTNPGQGVGTVLDESEVLPAINGTWILNDAMQFRVGASRTLNRPDLKELSEAPYIDPEERYVVIGNPNLEIATINNYDFRYEWYWSTVDSLQVALFYKEFDQPIERVIRLGAGGIRSFANAESAESRGVEVSVRNSLGVVNDSLENFYLKFNGALIDSEVDIGQAGAQQTTNNRELQGQSPWVVNFQFGYDNPFRDIQATLAYNIFGERITDVGTQGLPDAYEQPAGTLDLIYRHGFDLFGQSPRVKAEARNLLDPEYEVERGGLIERMYERGVVYEVGFDWILD